MHRGARLRRPANVHQSMAAGVKPLAPEEAGITDVTVSGLARDAEYDIYCLARDHSTRSAIRSSLEEDLSMKNPVYCCGARHQDWRACDR